jgi:hypothetical protein
MIKNDRYSLYNGTMEDIDLSCLINRDKCNTEEQILPKWKPTLEVFTSHTIDNIMEISTIADILGLRNAHPVLKTIVTLIILFLPIIIATIYLIATTKREKAKFD